ncbi:MAG: glycosyltransferase [Candidatus Saccharibacteria bacterium]|nr:glycosyltransferase [Candidatus Saccharibacteria bacterium]
MKKSAKQGVDKAQAEIDELKREKAALERENAELKLLVSSKRFRLADKMGNAFNSLFPVSSKRRAAVKGVARQAKKLSGARRRRVLRPLMKELQSLSAGFDRVMVVNSIPWDVELKQRPHHLAVEFAKLGYFVVFLECTNYLHNLRKINDSLVTINNPELLDSFRGLGKEVYFMQLSTIASISVEDILRFEKTVGMKVIYDYIDELHEDISGDLYHQRLIWNALPKIKPALVTVTSDVLLEQVKEHYTGSKIVVAKNAVNIDHFDFKQHSKAKPAKDFKKILANERPVVGYYGAIAPWIDYDMLNTLARKRSDIEFVYIGIDYGDALKHLELLPNVHYLGPKDYNDLASYSLFFDCAIIPFVRGEIAKATSPVKLFEYMAAGVPTVCTRDLQECRGYEYVFMSKDNKEFEANIDKAIIARKSIKARAALLKQAQGHTWTQRAKDIHEGLS